MSLEDLLAQDSVTVYNRGVTKDGQGGMSYGNRAALFPAVNGRVVSLSAREQLAWGQLNVTATYKLITKKDSIRGGMTVVSSDGRVFRVDGINRIQTMGTIDTYFEYAMNLVSAGG